MKVIITESRLERVAINWLNDNYGDLVPYENKELKFIFFKKNDEVIFEYNKETGSAYISYDNIWSFLESIFGLKYKEIQLLIKEWLRGHYNLDVTTTFLY